MDTNLSLSVDNDALDKDLIWMFDIKSGQQARWAELVGKVTEVYKEKRPDEQFAVVWNEFNDTKAGQDAVILFAMGKWAFLDRQENFGKLFEEVHGLGSWHNFLNEFNDTIDGRVDWMRMDVK